MRNAYNDKVGLHIGLCVVLLSGDELTQLDIGKQYVYRFHCIVPSTP